MRILLIQPKMNKRPMDTDLKTRMAPSLALLTLMNISPAEHEIILLNENIEHIDFSRTVDLVGITVTLDVMPRAKAIAEAFRMRGVPVVAGGIHVTCFPEGCLPYFDAICVGPAERVWARIITDARERRLLREYRDMEGFCGHEVVPPLYHFAGNGKYLYTNVVTTSRGCPNRCAFCYNSCQNRMYITRPVSDVVKDIRSLGTRHVLFIDDNFIGNPGYTRDLVAEITPLKLIWSAAVTARILEYPDLLGLMAQSGCQSLFIGFESINTESLESVNKDNKVSLYERLVDAIHSHGIMVNASMVFGLDGDDQSTFMRTLEWLVKMRVETLTSHILTPYPGTELYRRMEAAGRIHEHDLTKYNTAHVVFKPANMTAEELYKGYRWIYSSFYSIKNIIRRFPTNKKQRVPYLLFNLFYRKFGKLTSALSRVVPMRTLGRIAAKFSYKV